MVFYSTTTCCISRNLRPPGVLSANCATSGNQDARRANVRELVELMGILYLVGLLLAVLTASTEDVCEKGQHIYAAVIYSPPLRKSPESHRLHRYMQWFKSGVFNNSVVEMRFFPSIYVEACFQSVPSGFDKGHGSNLAHKEVWDYFYRHRRSCGIDERDTLFVFEYDAFQGMSNAGEFAIAAARKMTTDFHFLGYCFQKPSSHPSISKKAPYCLHAYALQLVGAKKLLELVDSCSFFADAQVAILADSKKISWSYETTSYDKRFVDNYFFDHGIHISGPFLYDGIFVQAKFDPAVKFQEGDVVNNKMRGKELHVLVNATWRSIPNMEVFASLELTRKKVSVVSEWQFKAYPEGPPLKQN